MLLALFFVQDGRLHIGAGDWCRCAPVITTPNVKTPARKERKRERERGRVGSLAAWRSWADLSSHTVTHRLSAVQFTFQSSHLKTERGRMRAVGGCRRTGGGGGGGDGVCAETMVLACVKKDFNFYLAVSSLEIQTQKQNNFN